MSEHTQDQGAQRRRRVGPRGWLNCIAGFLLSLNRAGVAAPCPNVRHNPHDDQHATAGNREDQFTVHGAKQNYKR